MIVIYSQWSGNTIAGGRELRLGLRFVPLPSDRSLWTDSDKLYPVYYLVMLLPKRTQKKKAKSAEIYQTV